MLIAHRGNLTGKEKVENSLPCLIKAVNQGHGVEIDLRLASNNKLIISHDPAEYTPEIDAKHILSTLDDAFIALNIKEEGLLPHLLKITNKINGFVFDFELCCSNPEEEMKDYRKAGFKIAKRYSDRGEFPLKPYDYVWLDEMDNSNSLDISNLDLSKVIYVSPELHQRPVLERRLEYFFGICTDFFLKLPLCP